MRKIYVKRKQHPSVSDYVSRNLSAIESYLNDNADRLLAERAASGRRYKGHDMRWANGQEYGTLGSRFKQSRNRAMGGSNIKKALNNARRLGRATSAGQIRKAIKNNHLVKFGVDPFHR